uniref:RNA recognition motif containing protein n=1 Tax=Oryza sativa subsp. indica TaxID=39946 RepID=D0AB69_ORYSI|nr:RNA recognition motif containing protein [Oryza sativa Indica Group]
MGKAEARSREHGGGGGGGSGGAGKIFVGGLPRDTTEADFVKHFGQYGEIVDSVIMRDKHTSQPRGFGFITYSNPAVVDRVMDDIHEFNGKQVEIKRTIPKDSVQSKDFKTKKIFVGGLPQAQAEDDFKHFFQKYGPVVDHQIMRDHQTKRSRGFGFIVFSSDQVVDDLLANGKYDLILLVQTWRSRKQ